VVLFHVTADTTWSNLPLSGLFVDMLRRVVGLAGTPDDVGAEARTAGARTHRASPDARRLRHLRVAASERPRGRPRPCGTGHRGASARFYGPLDSSLAVNALLPGDRLAPLDYAPLSARFTGLVGAQTLDLRAPLLTLALLLFVLDTVASLWLSGHLANLFGRMRRAGATAAILLAAGLALAPLDRAGAQGLPPLSRDEAQAALVTHLAYVITGDSQVDATSKAGLTGLTQMLANRTALEPGEPVGVDPARDEIAFYPVLYWPIVAGRAQPSEAAVRKLDAFMKGGGTVVFDTRDALNARPAERRLPRASTCAGCSQPWISRNSNRCRRTTS
jgi:hypothetical protein